MPSEEGKQVLKLLADGKIDAEQAYRLLVAIGDVAPEAPRAPHPPSAPPSEAGRPGAGRLLRIRITEGGKQKVNIAVPLGLARLARIGGIADQLSARYGIELNEILRGVQASPGGKIVDVVDEDDGGRVEIYVE